MIRIKFGDDGWALTKILQDRAMAPATPAANEVFLTAISGDFRLLFQGRDGLHSPRDSAVVSARLRELGVPAAVAATRAMAHEPIASLPDIPASERARLLGGD